MFGLFRSNKVLELIKTVCINRRSILYYGFKEAFADTPHDFSEAQARTAYAAVLDEFKNAVYADIQVHAAAMSQNISTRLSIVFVNSSILGFDELIEVSPDFLLSPAMVYAMLYWSINNRLADTRDITNLNHFYRALIDEVLQQLDVEQSKIN